MAQEEFEVKLGSGGEILPENVELLKLIKETPELPPAALLKFGAYYRGHSTTRSQGNYLVLIALLQLVNDPDAKDTNQEALVRTAAKVGIAIGTPEDTWDKEDYRDLACDDPKEGGCFPHLRAIALPNTNLELLIETPPPYDQHFIIGLVPAGPVPTIPIPWAS